MRAGRPSIIRWASHAAVAMWLGVVLAGFAAERAETSAVPESVAQVQPRAEPPPQPAAPAPPKTPEPARAPEPEPKPEAPRRVSQREIDEGSELLADGGRFPALSSSYEDFASFADYARAMGALGARFAVVRHREIVGTIDPATGAIGAPALDRPFSPRARDYAGEPGLAELARAARARFGPEAVVMMLVPREIDAGLFGGIARALAERGESPVGVREIRARYERAPGGGVRLRVDSALRLDGSQLAMDLVFDLAQIARARGSAA